MKGDRLLFAAVMLSVSTAPALAAWPYDSIVSFGDSLSDVGNLFLETGAPGAPYYDGQFSNGPIWLEDLASKMGLPAPEPSLAGGTDYAFGAATTGYAATNFPFVPNLVQQVAEYTATTKGSSNTLYTFSIGANDLFGAIGDVADGGIKPLQAFGYAKGAAAIVATEAGDLQQDGATDLVLFDVPDLSKTPDMLAQAADISATDGPLVADLFLAFVQTLSAYFDAQVLEDLAPVEADGLTVHDLGAFKLMDQIVKDPGAYGFSNVTDEYLAACGSDPSCLNSNGYLFWDAVHPTSQAGELIAADAYAKVIPEPSTWAMMAIGFAGLGLAGARAGRRGRAANANALS